MYKTICNADKDLETIAAIRAHLEGYDYDEKIMILNYCWKGYENDKIKESLGYKACCVSKEAIE